MMRIARGLKQSYKNARVFSVAETVKELDDRTDCYEVLNETENRVYLDIDGKVQESATLETFNETRTQTEAVIAQLAQGHEYALLESSKFDTRKISYRVIFPNLKATKKDNKLIAQHFGSTMTFPENVSIDLVPYGANQKIRMCGQNKDGEKRPLVLRRGTVEETFISLVPETAQLAQVPAPPPTRRGRPKKILENTLITDILAELNLTRIDDYETWIRIGMICFNEGQDVSVWDRASERGTKYKTGECEKKWKTFTKGNTGIAKLWEWLKEDNPNAYELLKRNDYAFRKEQFEQTHIKLNNPCRYLRIFEGKGMEGTTQLIGVPELKHIYGSEKVGDKSFVDTWVQDPEIRTCEKMEFRPKQTATPGNFNLWTEFAIDPVEGDWSAVRELLWDLSGRDTKTFDYLFNYIAHLFQKPWEKPDIMIIFASIVEGIGKDTLCDCVIGPILGEKYYMTTTDHENEVFGRFTSHLRTKLVLKMEELQRECCHKNNDKLKGLITCKTMDYEEKGLPKGNPLRSYVRVFGTTNDPCPVVLTADARRYLLVNPFTGRAGDKAYWSDLIGTRLNESALAAFHHACLARDIEGWNPRMKFETDAIQNARQAQAPPHARWFQQKCQFRMDDEGVIPDDEVLTQTFRRLRDDINATCKYAYADYRLREELKEYPQVEKPRHTRDGTEWSFNMKQVRQYLEQRGWWVEGI